MVVYTALIRDEVDMRPGLRTTGLTKLGVLSLLLTCFAQALFWRRRDPRYHSTLLSLVTGTGLKGVIRVNPSTFV